MFVGGGLVAAVPGSVALHMEVDEPQSKRAKLGPDQASSQAAEASAEAAPPPACVAPVSTSTVPTSQEKPVGVVLTPLTSTAPPTVSSQAPPPVSHAGTAPNGPAASSADPGASPGRWILGVYFSRALRTSKALLIRAWPQEPVELF